MKTLSAPFTNKLLVVVSSAFLMTAAFAAATTVAHYRFEEGSGESTAIGAVDSSGNGYDMEEVIGSPVYSIEPGVSTLPLTGESNAFALDLREGNHAIQGTDGEGLSQVEFNDFTLEAWVNLDSVAGWQTIVGRDDRGRQFDTSDSLFYFQKSGNAVEGQPANTFRVALITSEGELLVSNSGFILAPNMWYHLAAVGDTEAGVLSLYVNGSLMSVSEGFTGLFKPNPATRWTIGRGQWGEDDSADASEGEWDWVNGKIDEVRFSSAALTPVEFLNFNTALLTFVTHPQDAAAPVGDPVSFTAQATGGGEAPLVFEWEVSEDAGETWNLISGATSSSFTIESVTLESDANRYRAVATRGEEIVTSESATLTIVRYPDPIIIRGLALSPLTLAGENFQFSVEAAGIGNINYQWQYEGVNLEGQTGATLDLGVVDFDSAGNYSIVVTDDAAEADGLNPATLKLSSFLTVAPPLKSAISLNFVGAGYGDAFSQELGSIGSDETAGAVSVANWNNSATVSGVANQIEGMLLFDDSGVATPVVARWEAGATGAARSDGGTVETKDADQRIFHGFIERRAGPSSPERTPATVVFSGIPYESYDVYVYPMAVEGTPGSFFRTVSMEDATGTRTLFMRNLIGKPTVDEIPFILSHATTIEEAKEGPMATYFRFEGASGSTLVLQHFDEIGWNSGGFAGISIVDTSVLASEPPVIVSQPIGASVHLGESASFAVAASGREPLTYQWHHEGTRMAGANGPELTIDSATAADSGHYVVVVRNGDGSALSVPASLNVHPAPALTYDSWISGFGLAAEERGEEANPVGDGLSNLAKYSLGMDPTREASFSFHRHLGVRFPFAPEAEDVELFAEVSEDLVSWASTALGDYPYKEIVLHDDGSYRLLFWTENSLEEAPRQFIRIGLNSSVVHTPVGSVSAQAEALSPAISVQPRDAATHLGKRVTLSVEAAGGGFLEYQWYRNGVAIEGEGNSTLSLENLSLAQAGRYTVLVMNEHGNVLSRDAHLTVHPVEALPYQTWISGFGLPVAQQAEEATPAGDGIPNLLTYILGGNPIEPNGSAVENRLVFSFDHPAVIVGIRFSIEVSADLSDWESIPLDSHPHRQVVEIEDGYYRVYVWFDESFEETVGKFTRLRVSR